MATTKTAKKKSILTQWWLWVIIIIILIVIGKSGRSSDLNFPINYNLGKTSLQDAHNAAVWAYTDDPGVSNPLWDNDSILNLKLKPCDIRIRFTHNDAGALEMAVSTSQKDSTDAKFVAQMWGRTIAKKLGFNFGG